MPGKTACPRPGSSIAKWKPRSRNFQIVPFICWSLVFQVHSSGVRPCMGLGPMGAELVQGFSPPAVPCWAGPWVSALEKPDSWEGRRGWTDGPPRGHLGPFRAGWRAHGQQRRGELLPTAHHITRGQRAWLKAPGGAGCPCTTWPTPGAAGPRLPAGTSQPSCWSSQLTDQRNMSRRETITLIV